MLEIWGNSYLGHKDLSPPCGDKKYLPLKGNMSLLPDSIKQIQEYVEGAFRHML